MRRLAPILIYALTVAPQLLQAAEPPEVVPMTAEEFETYTQGKTVTYSADGQVYGAEEYLPGRRVRWAYTEDICREGDWYEEAGQICFTYDYDPRPQCWVFWQDGGLNALFMGSDSGTRLREYEVSRKPLPCAGPEVGV